MSKYTEYNEWANSFDWPHLAQECTESARLCIRVAPVGDHVDDDGNVVGTTYLGKVFNIMPSGKYYTFWACSNLDPCPACEGTGYKPHAERACRICNGMGFRRINENFTAEWVAKLADHGLHVGDDMPCNLCQGTGWCSIECPECGGLGSREAYLDELANKALSDAAEAAGGWLECGEGDPTDLYFARWVAPEEMAS